MKGEFGIVALLFSSITFAAPVSTPNNANDTPIISGGGSVSGGGTCRAYQTDGTAVDLSGGETLVFYGTGYLQYYSDFPYVSYSYGGYLSTKPNYSGTAYVKVKGGITYGNYHYGNAIGLFARNTDSKGDFIAGAGAGGTGYSTLYAVYAVPRNSASGGGWRVIGYTQVCYSYNECYVNFTYGGDASCLYSSPWFTAVGTPGFCGSGMENLGGASSISAWYNSYTKDYTSFSTSLTISGGGYLGGFTPALYVCQ
jgi:hypothetical protein